MARMLKALFSALIGFGLFVACSTDDTAEPAEAPVVVEVVRGSVGRRWMSHHNWLNYGCVRGDMVYHLEVNNNPGLAVSPAHPDCDGNEFRSDS